MTTSEHALRTRFELELLLGGVAAWIHLVGLSVCGACGAPLRARYGLGEAVPAGCWMNSQAQLGWMRAASLSPGAGAYVEGFVVRAGNYGFDFAAHAWVEVEAAVVDVTPHAHAIAYFPALRFADVDAAARSLELLAVRWTGPGPVFGAFAPALTQEWWPSRKRANPHFDAAAAGLHAAARQAALDHAEKLGGLKRTA